MKLNDSFSGESTIIYTGKQTSVKYKEDVVK